MTPLNPSEERSEAVDHLSRVLSKLRERVDNRLTLNRRRLREDYLNTRPRIQMGCCFVDAAEEHVAIFQRISVGSSNTDPVVWRLPVPVWEAGADHGSDVEVDRFVRSGNGNGQSMFVHDVQLVDGSDRLVLPSVVRLQRKEVLNHVVVSSLHLLQNEGLPLRARRCLWLAPDGEGDVLDSGGNRDRTKRKMIERGSKMVGDVSNPKSDLDEHLGESRLPGLEQQCQPIMGFRIRPGDDFVRLTEEANPLVQVLDVLIGPFELPINTPEVTANWTRNTHEGQPTDLKNLEDQMTARLSGWGDASQAQPNNAVATGKSDNGVMSGLYGVKIFGEWCQNKAELQSALDFAHALPSGVLRNRAFRTITLVDASIHLNGYEGSLTNAPALGSGLTIAGPHPYKNREWWGTLVYDDANDQWILI